MPAGAPNDYKAPNDHFHQRVDRHGNPFGQRVAAVSKTVGVRNKITPVPNRPGDLGESERQHRAYPSRHYYGNSPPYSSRRVDRQTQRSDSRKEHSTRGTPEIQGTAIWREKQPTEERLEEDSQNLVRSARPPVGRNLETHDFPPLPLIPTTEEVMEELQLVTRLYTSCDDPVESAARKQRVLVSDAQGLMEETAQGIFIAAQKAQAAQTQLQEEILAQAPIILLPAKPTNRIGSSTQQPTTGITGKKRGRPARTRDLRISPKTFTGASSCRRIMSSIHSSSGGAAGTPHVGPPKEMDRDLMVSDLLTRGTNEWNVAKIKDLFPSLASCITSIIPSLLGAPDEFIWIPNKDGKYTTKSGYTSAVKYNSLLENGGSPLPVLEWSKKGALPLGANLEKRGCGSTVTCPRCGERETASVD
ncbi:hypothetical protein HID58_070168 [Brassica napus]|uniref:Uncharacterized protein n=1 Tax=Brassica napus TaxID=3708 RepID=A0ABQ7YY26_BRANA|nr:hypothetical protein HID58_070168 [Brassica napus]